MMSYYVSLRSDFHVVMSYFVSLRSDFYVVMSYYVGLNLSLRMRFKRGVALSII